MTLDLVRDREAELNDEYAANLGDHDLANELYERSKAAWRGQRPKGGQAEDDDPPRRPSPQVARRVMVEDTTTEALAVALSENPRGLILAADELNSWLAGMDRYGTGKGGSDEAFYLKCYSGRSHNVLRRGGGRLHVRQAALWITGTIQPGVLRRSLSAERKEAGLAARMLLAAPPRRPALWSEETVSAMVRDCFGQVVRRLYELQPCADVGGRENSLVVPLSYEAKKLWIDFYNTHNEEAAALVGDLLAAWSKLEETAGRLALILHETKVASRQAKAGAVDAATMSQALRLAEWFKNETRRVYGILAEDDLDQANRQDDERLLAFIDRQASAVTPRDVLTGCRWIETAADAEAALKQLVDAGRGRWEDRPPGEKGGRPTRHFVSAASAQPSSVRSKLGFADADTADSAALEYDLGNRNGVLARVLEEMKASGVVTYNHMVVMAMQEYGQVALMRIVVNEQSPTAIERKYQLGKPLTEDQYRTLFRNGARQKVAELLASARLGSLGMRYDMATQTMVCVDVREEPVREARAAEAADADTADSAAEDFIDL
ncbi:MAG: DUF3987 domain-containing protein [Planctomycetota bacterium]|nr:MAG: DUF3987 domain-containing protein [Planctomycetota bacterium]